MEAVIVIDVLRRAGADVTVASVEKALRIDASWGLKLVADALISDCAGNTFDLISLPVIFFFFRLEISNFNPAFSGLGFWCSKFCILFFVFNMIGRNAWCF